MENTDKKEQMLKMRRLLKEISPYVYQQFVALKRGEGKNTEKLKKRFTSNK